MSKTYQEQVAHLAWRDFGNVKSNSFREGFNEARDEAAEIAAHADNAIAKAQAVIDGLKAKIAYDEECLRIERAANDRRLDEERDRSQRYRVKQSEAERQRDEAQATIETLGATLGAVTTSIGDAANFPKDDDLANSIRLADAYIASLEARIRGLLQGQPERAAAIIDEARQDAAGDVDAAAWGWRRVSTFHADTGDAEARSEAMNVAASAINLARSLGLSFRSDEEIGNRALCTAGLPFVCKIADNPSGGVRLTVERVR